MQGEQNKTMLFTKPHKECVAIMYITGRLEFDQQTNECCEVQHQPCRSGQCRYWHYRSPTWLVNLHHYFTVGQKDYLYYFLT